METEIKQQFDEMGIEPSNAAVEKCVDLAISYNIEDATEFVEQWMAFSLSNLHGEDPTPENLGEFERKVLQVKREKGPSNRFASKNKPKSLASNTLDTNALSAYGIPDHAVLDDDDMMDTYMSESVGSAPNTPKAVKQRAQSANLKTDVLFSPASYTPQSANRIQGSATPSQSQDNTGSFGHPKLLANASWQSQLDHCLTVKQLLLSKGTPMTASSLKYMMDLLTDKCELLQERIVNIGQMLVQKKFGSTRPSDCSWYPQDKNSLDALHKLHVVGMIHSDDDGPLDAHSTMLAVMDADDCNFLSLNFSRAKSVSVFPGQVVLAIGFIPKGNTFVVEEMYTERVLTPPPPLKLDRELVFVVASGPFTYSDDLFYEPLHDLLKYLNECRPDVLVLTGPFLDAEHKGLNELAETFDSFFEKMIAGVMETVGSNTTVLLVSSQKDALSHSVYPTPPPKLRRTYTNLHLLPDPSLVDLDGITLGITSTDVVDHLLSHEFAQRAGEQMHRVVNHLFNQGSFYPICPSPDEKMSYDSALAEQFAQLNQPPNILILPSNQRTFTRLINNCLVVNPGRLSAKSAAGTYARFLIAPPAPGAQPAVMFNNVACQIKRV